MTTLQDVGPPAAGDEAEELAAGAVDDAAAGCELVAGEGELQAAISAVAARLVSVAKPRQVGRDFLGLVRAPGMATGPGRVAAVVLVAAGAAPFTGQGMIAATGIGRFLAGVSFISSLLS